MKIVKKVGRGVARSEKKNCASGGVLGGKLCSC